MKKLTARSRKIMMAAPLAAALAPASHADIVYTSLGAGQTISSGSMLYFNAETGHYAGSGFPGVQFELYFKPSANNVYFKGINGSVVASDDNLYNSKIYHRTYKLSYGTPILPLLEHSVTYMHFLFNSQTFGLWAPDGSINYAGFQDTASNYGWAEISYNVDKSVTLYGFAYNSTGQDIRAGQTVVPEPGAAGIIGAVVAGSAAAWAARRKRAKKA